MGRGRGISRGGGLLIGEIVPEHLFRFLILLALPVWVLLGGLALAGLVQPGAAILIGLAVLAIAGLALRRVFRGIEALRRGVERLASGEVPAISTGLVAADELWTVILGMLRHERR